MTAMNYNLLIYWNLTTITYWWLNILLLHLLWIKIY